MCRRYFVVMSTPSRTSSLPCWWSQRTRRSKRCWAGPGWAKHKTNTCSDYSVIILPKSTVFRAFRRGTTTTNPQCRRRWWTSLSTTLFFASRKFAGGGGFRTRVFGVFSASAVTPPPSFQGGRSAKVHGENWPRGGAEGPAQGEGQVQEAQGETPSTRHVGLGVGTLPTLRSQCQRAAQPPLRGRGPGDWGRGHQT